MGPSRGRVIAASVPDEGRVAGIDVDELLDWGGGVPPMFVLRDPDGNRLVIVQQPPRS
jgi:hypothetical protein